MNENPDSVRVPLLRAGAACEACHGRGVLRNPDGGCVTCKGTGANPAKLYASLVALGIPTDSHESDLYVKATAEARALILASGLKGFSYFNHQQTGEAWIDVPFAYAPFWENRARP